MMILPEKIKTGGLANFDQDAFYFRILYKFTECCIHCIWEYLPAEEFFLIRIVRI